jgi:MraZ protein
MAQVGTVNYTGRFERSLDDKGRLTLPSDWRQAHDETQTFLAVPNDGHITVLPPDEVEKIRGQIKALKLKDKLAQAAATKFFSEAQTFSFDKAGRVILDAALLEQAGIERDVVCAGALTKFNIFSPARWKQEKALADAAAKAPEGDMFTRLDI